MHNDQVQVIVNTQQQICLSGRIDLTNVVAACAKITETLNGLPSVRIDLAGIESADSSSLALFTECIRYAKQNNKDVRFYNVPHFILDLGRVCGLDSILPINKPLVFH